MALSTNTTTQSVDRQTGIVITRANNQNRRSFETQLKIAQQNRDTLSKKIDNINDSITSLDTKILDIASKEIESGELGSIKYLSEITGWNIKKTANFFILTLIFVFDPLAIALVVSTNQAFIAYRRKKEEEEENKPVIEENFEEDEIEIPESYFAKKTFQEQLIKFANNCVQASIELKEQFAKEKVQSPILDEICSVIKKRAQHVTIEL
jgi:hypothetical protein